MLYTMQFTLHQYKNAVKDDKEGSWSWYVRGGKITCIILTVCIEGEGGDFWYHIMKDELHMIRDDNLFDNGPGVEAKF
jgi:hypothetical protein